MKPKGMIQLIPGMNSLLEQVAMNLWAPRIISTLQRLCEHGKAANEAAE
jgi:hypothetical protein